MLGGLFLAVILLPAAITVAGGQVESELEDITGRYSFLSADDLLAILDEDGDLAGYIDVYQTEGESDDIFSYTLAHGTRRGRKVEFKTITIHGLYYRFSGKVERGEARKPHQRDYFRLIGSLAIVRRNPATREEKAERRHVVLESLGDE